MLFAWDITITANTSESAPKTEILKLTNGTIKRVDIHFPAGCHGLVKVRILRSEFQLIPITKGEWVTGDNATVLAEPNYLLDTAPSQLKFIGCSPSTSYSHKITVRVDVQREDKSLLANIDNKLASLLEGLGIEQ